MLPHRRSRRLRGLCVAGMKHGQRQIGDTFVELGDPKDHWKMVSPWPRLLQCQSSWLSRLSLEFN